MGAWRFFLAFCLPFVVFSHNHGGTLYNDRQIGRKPESVVVPDLLIPAYPFDGKRCISFARKTKTIDIPLPYLCIPGKPGGLPLPTKNDKATQATLIAMYWSGWRVCQKELKMPMNNYIKVPTCCPGWESGPLGECTVPKQGRMHGPCLNGGFLSPDSRNQKCICPPGFKGTFCQIPCPMAFSGMKPFEDRMPNMMKQILPRMRNLMNVQRRHLLNNLGPRNLQLRNMFMPTMMKKINPFSIPGIMGFSRPNPMTMLNIMAMKKLMSFNKGRYTPMGTDRSGMTSQVNTQQIPNANNMDGRRQPTNPMYTVNNNADKTDQNQHNIPQQSIPVEQIHDLQQPQSLQNQQQTPTQEQQQQQLQQQHMQLQQQQIYQPNHGIPQRVLISQIQPSVPYFSDKMVYNEAKCKEILKIGITRCVQGAGINALPEAIFESNNPNNAGVIQQICSLPGDQLASCILAGQNACGNGVQVGITRRMLLEFISSLGKKCMPRGDPVSPMYNAGVGPAIQPYNAVRMPPFTQHITPHASMVPMPPTNMRTGRKPFLPLQENRIMAVPPLGQDLKRIDCLNGGYVVIDNGKSVCQCPEDFNGETCEIPVCNPECLNGATCESVDGMAMCICAVGFSGLQCEEAISEDEADITALVDDTSLTQDTAGVVDAETSQVIDSYPIPHLPKEVPQGFITTERAVKETKTVKPVETQKKSDIQENQKQKQEEVEAVKTEITGEDFNMDDYPLWMILSVSFGALLLVLILTTCVCMCVKRRSRRVVTVSTTASSLPEKSPMKDNIYVVGIPPPVYEVKGIPPLSYEEAKGEVINGEANKDVEAVKPTETEKQDEDKKELGGGGTRI